jgi:multiple sugar transport system permease protein
MLLTSIKPNREMFEADNILWIRRPTFENFIQLIRETLYLKQFRNSIMVTVVSTVTALLVSVPAAYSLTRLRYPGRRVASGLIFFFYLVPPILLMIPMYLLFIRIRLINTPFVLMLSYLTLTVPFCTWMLKGYFQSIPMDLEEAALVDGCNRIQALRMIVVPLAAPGIMTSAIFAFTLAWNEYLYAYIFVSSGEMTTLPVGLSKLIVGDVVLWGQIMAGSAVMSLPILFVYILGQRYIISGMTAGAVKG